MQTFLWFVFQNGYRPILHLFFYIYGSNQNLLQPGKKSWMQPYSLQILDAALLLPEHKVFLIYYSYILK